MAYYDYQCQDCNSTVQIKASIKEKELGLQVKCPDCNSQNTRQIFQGMAFVNADSMKQSGDNNPVGPCGHSCACAN